MKRLLVLEQWDSFSRTVIPANAPLEQKREMRRAFYAGAQCLLHSVMLALSADADPTEGDLTMMADLERELSDFAEAVKAGRA